jgi:putative spermidine/putrescine transport system permease protein
MIRQMRDVLIGLPITVLLIGFFALPLAMVLILAFRPFDAQAIVGDGWTLRNFGRMLFDATYLAAFARTVWISLVTTLLCIVIAYPVAWHLDQLKSRQARLWLTLVALIPLMTSLVVSSFAWVLMLGGNGVLNRFLLGIGLLDQPLRLLNTTTGVVIVSVYSYVSYLVLAIFSSLQTIDKGYAKAARIHGADDFQSFVRVTLPLSMPGVVSGGLIVFSLMMAGFVIPFLIGGGRVNVVPLLIFQFTLQLFDWPGAAALGVLLFALTLGATWVIASLAQRRMRWEA